MCYATISIDVWWCGQEKLSGSDTKFYCGLTGAYWILNGIEMQIINLNEQ